VTSSRSAGDAMPPDLLADQRETAHALGVAAAFDGANDARRRTMFLASELQRAQKRVLVLGISGGVASLTARYSGDA